MRNATAAIVGLSLVLAGGCATNQEQVANSVYQTHRIVKDLDQNLSPRIDDLSKSTTELTARVEASDNQVRKLQSLLEENQYKLDELQEELAQMRDFMYQRGGYTTGGGQGSGIEFEEPEVVVPPSHLGQPAETGQGEGQQTGTEAPLPPATGVVSANAVADYNKALSTYLEQADYAAALEQFGSFLQRYPNNDFTGRAQFWKGMCNFHLKQYREAIADFKKLRTDYPSSEKVAMGMYYQALAHSVVGETDRAIELLEQLVKDYPPTEAVTEQARAALNNLKSDQ